MFEIQETTKALIAGGFFGSLTRLLLNPEKRWKAWIVQIIVGVLCAVFLGGAVGHWLDIGPPGYAAAAYIFGTAAENALAVAQQKLFNKK